MWILFGRVLFDGILMPEVCAGKLQRVYQKYLHSVLHWVLFGTKWDGFIMLALYETQLQAMRIKWILPRMPYWLL